MINCEERRDIQVTFHARERERVSGWRLEEQRAHAAHFTLLLDEDLEVLIDDGDGEQDSRARPDGTHEVSQHRQGADAKTAERSRRRNVAIEFVDHGLFSVTSHHHLLLLQLLGDVFGRRSRDFDPRLGEEGARPQHEHDVHHRVDGILQHVSETFGRGEVVAESTDGIGSSRTAAADVRPHAQQVDQEVARKFMSEHLGNDVEIGDQSALKDDGDVGGVEEFDGIRRILSSVSGRLDGQIHAESLKVDDDDEDQHRRQQVHQIGQVLTVKGFAKSAHFVRTRGQKVEQGDDSSLKLRASASVDGGGGEGLPDDGFADVGGDEEGDARAESVALLQQLVEQQDDEAGDEELDDDEQTDARSDAGGISVHPSHDVNDSLTQSDDHSEQFLRSVKKCSVLGRVADFDDFGAGEELHDHTGSDDRRNAQFHQSSSIRSQDDSHPIKRIRRIRRHDAEQRDLTTDQEDEKGDGRP